GENAPGGARSFLDDKRRLTGGFAYLAWPQHYGTTGVMTFLLGPDGTVFQKDLGSETDAAVEIMKTYDPDLGWTLVDISGGWRGARENPAPAATTSSPIAAAAENTR
ncbi:MAG: DUF2950 family protein, partial [Rhodospirillales bacterium]|nr:DUF2950 family protein [Rhodospirillales bacterium]